jgi:perosamine synthetase
MGYRSGQFPAAETLYASELSLPIWPGMSDAQLDRVAEAVRAATA